MLITLLTSILFSAGCNIGSSAPDTGSSSGSTASGSTGSGDTSDSSGDDEIKPEDQSPTVAPLSLPEIIEPAENLSSFIAQAQDKFGTQRDGIIVSPYYTVRVGKVEAPVYAVPTSYGNTQNVAFVDVNKDAFPLSVRISSSYAVDSAKVLPEKYNVICTKQGNDTLFTVSSYGYYTVQFNCGYNDVLTLCVREYDEPDEFEGYNVIEYKSGIHFVDYIDIPSNTVLYLHRGAYLIANAPNESEIPESAENYHGETTWRPFIRAKDASNVKIKGRGVIDLSALYWCARNPVDFNRCDNVEIDGITIVNTANWNMTIANCKNVTVKNCVMLSYRRNSDGIAIVDCDGAVVSDCFARSGDDLFEVKSMYRDSDVVCQNIRFERCIAWADSCRCFGVIHETAKDITGVVFEDCAMLYAMAAWSPDMGSLVVINGVRGKVSEVTFRNIEVYNDAQYAMNVATGPNEWSESSEVGVIENVLYENIRIVKGGWVRIKAPDSDECYVSGITYKGITFGNNLCLDLNCLNIEYLGNVGDVVYEK